MPLSPLSLDRISRCARGVYIFRAKAQPLVVNYHGERERKLCRSVYSVCVCFIFLFFASAARMWAYEMSLPSTERLYMQAGGGLYIQYCLSPIKQGLLRLVTVTCCCGAVNDVSH